MPPTPGSGEDHVLAKRVAEEVLATPDMVIQRELEALARSYLELQEALGHMRDCSICAERGVWYCETGRAALEALDA